MQLPTCLSPIPGGTRWPPPVDIRDLAIRLETEGVSDMVARADFGFEGTWEMAEAYFSKLSQPAPVWNPPATLTRTEPRNFLSDYLNGISFGLPLLFSCVAILLFRFSLWGGELPSDQASAIGLGIACSFIASGGFVQAMSRRGLWYIGTCQFRRCANWTWNSLIQATGALLLFGVVGVAISGYFNWFPSRLAWLAAAFYSSLTLLWLSMGILYMLEKNLVVAAAALMGIANVALLHRAFGLDLLLSQMISIALAACFGIAVSMLTLKRWSRDRAGEVVREPAGRTIYYLWPYFVYGCLYFLFLFGDRLLAWTARTEASGRLFQFRGSYEAAQDVALFAFIFQVGWVHSATVRFFKRLKACQEELSTEQIEEFNYRLTRIYGRMFLWFVPIALTTTAAVYLGARSLGFFSDPLQWKVMVWSLAGYMLLVLSLRNASLLFALSRPLYALRAIGCACVANIGVGYLLSRFGSYDLAVIGFAIGAAVFAALSTWHSLQVLRRLDYNYFASAT